MGISEQIRRQLINSFRTEQSEHVQKINESLLVLEKNPSGEDRQALLDEIFREAHSLKGAARSVGMTVIESLGHGLEDILFQAKEGCLDFSPELFDLLYQALDAVELLVERVEAGDSTPPAKVLTLLARLEEATTNESAPQEIAENGQAAADDDSLTDDSPPRHHPPPAATDQAAEQVPGEVEADENAEAWSLAAASKHQQDETIRVSVNKLDVLMAQVSELLGAKIRAEQRLAEVRRMQQAAGKWHSEWLALRGHHSRLQRPDQQERFNGYGKDVTALLDFVAHNQEQLRAWSAHTNSFYRQLSNDTMRLSLLIDELQEEIKRVRMQPLATITATFGRMVRDLARSQNKQVALNISGEQTELDKRVLEQIKDPLIHLLRNTIDHGLETVAEREQAGKPVEGRVELSATQQGNNVVITISDDGRGLDLPAIRQSAVRKGGLSRAEVEKLSETEVAQLIFSSGLSTSKIITDISGRGVGLDVVRQNVEALHGTVEVHYEAGQCTTFTLTLPLTLANSRGLLVRAGEQTFVLPLNNVERLLQADGREVDRVEGKAVITYQNNPVALAWLADLLELPRHSEASPQLTVVIVKVADKQLGLIVDDLSGEQEVVMKGLGKQLSRVGGIAGATILGSGQVVLVLHAADLTKLAARTPFTPPVNGDVDRRDEPDSRKSILVVDDSITTRTLEKNILEAAGYEVRLATNGEEALDILDADGLPNLVVSDVNMPRLDGFGLTDRIKHDDRYASIPVILVTSLDSVEDKARGIEVGADAYIVKSSFDQGSLLEIIEQLV
jgi:two-component system chemotaxis sensor kinase CheA